MTWQETVDRLSLFVAVSSVWNLYGPMVFLTDPRDRLRFLVYDSADDLFWASLA